MIYFTLYSLNSKIKATIRGTPTITRISTTTIGTMTAAEIVPFGFVSVGDGSTVLVYIGMVLDLDIEPKVFFANF